MGVKVSRSETVVEAFGHMQVRRYLRREDQLGIGIGVSTFGPRSDSVDPASVWEAHDVPETHFVLEGHGVLYEEDEAIALAPGDVVVTEPGRRHVLFASGDEPLVTIYCAVSPR